MTEVRTITADELQDRLRDGTLAQFWNVLTDDYYTGELIPGSRRVPLDQVGREVTRTNLPKDTEIVVHCSGPGCPQSRAAAEKLTTLGYTNVHAFEGGLAAWKQAGLDLEPESGTLDAGRGRLGRHDGQH
jgi:rhodanese-related sulfurtransferase